MRYVVLVCLLACGEEITPAGDSLGYCDRVDNWDDAWAAREAETLSLVNEARAVGYDCDTEGSFGPAPALTLDLSLRCSARNHAEDMATRGYFEHQSPEGETPSERMERAGFVDWTRTGENIAAGQATAGAAMSDWLESDGHCANIMNPDFTYLGVGYYFDGDAEYGHYWTQNFGTR